MPRSSQLLHPPRPPATPLQAATLLLLRDGVVGPEVLMTRRSDQASFAPGAYVFPGGGIEAQDESHHALALRRSTQSDAQLTPALAAIRETFEELGLLMATRADGTMADASDIAQLNRHAPFYPQCAAQGLLLAASRLQTLAHWVGDRDLPRRFDVPFFIARMPENQTPVADESEQFEPVWVRPTEALAKHAAGQFFMLFPTLRTLEHLQGYANVDAVLAACSASEKPLWNSCPRTGLKSGREQRCMEHESAYGELALVCPDGQILHPLDWHSEAPVPLLKNVLRLTAPNPGAMTGPGTNAYVVGDPNTGFIVIDPGPNDPTHLKKLWRAAGGDIRYIVCTHSHPDHSPGALPLQALCNNRPDICGLPSAATARHASFFRPDRTLENNELLTLISRESDTNFTHTLKVLHTPGHAANHLCLVLLEDGLLFSGDHVLNGSTTVIDPPDGDMNAYLDSLDLLMRVCDQHQLDFILPAHGHVLFDAKQAIAKLKAHRLAREAKVLDAMQAQPQGSLDDWLAHAYDDVPQRMWPVAKRSLMAHVARIESGVVLGSCWHI